MPDYKGVFLPKSLKPFEYTLEIKPDIYTGNPDSFSFDGYVKIDILCEIRTDNITLHSKDLLIDEDSVYLHDSHGRTIAVESMEVNTQMQFLIIHVNESLLPTTVYALKIGFWGPLLEDTAGLYYTSYNSGNDTV